MTNVLQADATAGDAFAEKDLSGLPDVYYIDVDFIIPQATLDAFVAAGGGSPPYDSGDPIDFQVDGFFLQTDDGMAWNYWTNQDFAAGAGLLTADVRHTIRFKVDWNGGSPTSEVSVDGSVIFPTYTQGLPPDTTTFHNPVISLGFTDLVATPGAISYVYSIKVGTTPGAEDIFSDDFSSGDFSAWTSTTGDVSIIADPHPSANVRIVSPPWRFMLTTLGQAVLTFLDHRAINRQLDYYFRDAATASGKAPTITGRVYAADPEINILASDGEPFLAEGVRLLVALRREGGDPPWVCRGAGILTQPARVTEGDTQYVDFTSYGPRQLLYKRPARMADGSLIPRGGRTYTQIPGSTILREQLGLTIDLDGPVFIDITGGHLPDTDPIDFTIQQSATVGDVLDQLEQTGTMDVLLPAVWDPVGNPGNIAQLNIYPLAGSVKDGAIMAYDLFPHTLEDHDWLEDGEQRANAIEFYTVNGLTTPIVFDAASIVKYRKYWAQQTFPAQAGISAIEAAAVVQLLQRKGHPTTLSITPVPERAPVPFNEYNLADWLPTYISARSGKLLAGYYRAIQMTIQPLDDAVETVRLVMSSDLPPNGETIAVPGVGGGGGDTSPGGFEVDLFGFPASGEDISLRIAVG